MWSICIPIPMPMPIPIPTPSKYSYAHMLFILTCVERDGESGRRRERENKKKVVKIVSLYCSTTIQCIRIDILAMHAGNKRILEKYFSYDVQCRAEDI